MKKIITVSFLVFILSCKQSDKKNNPEASQLIHKEWAGNWVGNFMAEEYKEDAEFSYNNKINIRVISINANCQVKAQSIVAGNKRPLNGKYDSITNRFILKEPGDNKYDGVFDFIIKKDSLVGFWTANNKELIVTKRKFALVQKAFVYNKTLMLPWPDTAEFDEGYIDYTTRKEKLIKEDDSTTYTANLYRKASDAILKLNASTTDLKEDNLKNLKKLDLEIIRNTIYARHGYTFNKRAYRQFFDPVEWYVPLNDDVESKLTAIEIKNIILLKRFEKYAEDNYDTFGR